MWLEDWIGQIQAFLSYNRLSSSLATFGSSSIYCTLWWVFAWIHKQGTNMDKAQAAQCFQSTTNTKFFHLNWWIPICSYSFSVKSNNKKKTPARWCLAQMASGSSSGGEVTPYTFEVDFFIKHTQHSTFFFFFNWLYFMPLYDSFPFFSFMLSSRLGVPASQKLSAFPILRKDANNQASGHNLPPYS